MLRTLNERVVCGCRRTQERYQQHAVQSFSRTRISVWYPRYAFEHYNYNNLPTRLPAGCSFDCCHGTPLNFIWGEPPKPGNDVPLVVCCGGQPRCALDSLKMHFSRRAKKNKTKENHHENSTEASYQNTTEISKGSTAQKEQRSKP